MKSTEKTQLKVWCVPGLAFLWLSEKLGEFIAENPNIDIEFRPTDVAPDFRSNAIDIDIRFIRNWEDENKSKSIRGFEFARPKFFPVASGKLASRIGTLKSAADFLQYPLLHEDNDEGWRYWLEHQGLTGIDHLGGPRLWHANLTLDAAAQGAGIALANHLLVQRRLQTGELQRVVSEEPLLDLEVGGYSMMSREDRWDSPVISRFRSWLEEMVQRSNE